MVWIKPQKRHWLDRRIQLGICLQTTPARFKRSQEGKSMYKTDTKGTDSPRGRYPVKLRAKPWLGISAFVFITAAAVVGGRLFRASPVRASAPPVPVVTVSQPLEKSIHGRLQFLGQFSAVDQVELRAQVGGTLTRIGFKDGDIVKVGSLLFEIDPTQYRIKRANATAQAE
jgi:hypothetical protein